MVLVTPPRLLACQSGMVGASARRPLAGWPPRLVMRAVALLGQKQVISGSLWRCAWDVLLDEVSGAVGLALGAFGEQKPGLLFGHRDAGGLA